MHLQMRDTSGTIVVELQDDKFIKSRSCARCVQPYTKGAWRQWSGKRHFSMAEAPHRYRKEHHFSPHGREPPHAPLYFNTENVVNAKKVWTADKDWEAE